MTTNELGNQGRRLPMLDLLRGIAVALVLGRHATRAPDTVPASLRAVLDTWFNVGWIGVDLFFVLSGFLVSNLLFAEYDRQGRIDLKRFLMRRGLKIYPAFYAFLIITILINAPLGYRAAPGGVIAEAFFVQNYFTPLWNHTWSLAVEEHFYLILPLLLLALVARKKDGTGEQVFAFLLPLLLVVSIATLALRVRTASSGTFDVWRNHFPTHLRIDSLLTGTVAAYLWRYKAFAVDGVIGSRRGWAWALVGIGIAPMIILRIEHPFVHTVGYTLLSASFALMLLLLLTAPRNQSTAWPVWATALAVVGADSYSLYLWHMPVHRWVHRALLAQGGTTPYATEMFLYLGGSVLVGLVMARLVERPALRLRDRYLPSRSGSSPVAVTARTTGHPAVTMRCIATADAGHATANSTEL